MRRSATLSARRSRMITRGFHRPSHSDTLRRMGISRDVLTLAVRQGGYVTREQLLSQGFSRSGVDRRIRDGSLTPVAPGVFQVFPSDDHLDLMRGAALALPNAVVSHQSAAQLLRFPKLPKLVPTVVVPSHTTHRFPGVMVRRCDDLISTDIVMVDGLSVTSVARTFFDLARLLRFRHWDAIGESLVIANRMDLDQFEQTTQRLARRGKPGSRSAWDFLAMRAHGDPRATVLERRGRAILTSAGLPLPVPQFSIPWKPSNRFDDAYPDQQIAIEWDSRAWHEQRAAMASDRRRDREAASHGWVLLRFTWEDVSEKSDEVVATAATLLRDRRAAS